MTFEIRDQDGRVLPIQLPARLWRPNDRPLPEADVELLANCVSVAFDASRSTDPDGDQLSYQWEFGDGKSAQRPGAGPSRTPAPAAIARRCACSTPRARSAPAPVRRFEVFVKRPPMAVAGDDLVVAPGETVAFDGTGSLAGERPIARYFWDFYDGEPAPRAGTRVTPSPRPAATS